MDLPLKNDTQNEPKIDHSCQISRVRDSYLKGLRFISQGSEIRVGDSTQESAIQVLLHFLSSISRV